VFALVSFFAGNFSDKYDRGLIVALSCAVWSGATALQSQASGFSDLIPLRAIVGGSQAFFNPAAYTLLSDLFPKEKIGTVNGIFSGAVYLGGGLASLSILLDSAVGWKNTMISIGGIGIAIAVLAYLGIADPKKSLESQIELKAVSNENGSIANSLNSENTTTESPTDLITSLKEVTKTREAKLLLAAIGIRFCAGFSIAIWKAPFIFSKFPESSDLFASGNAAIVAGGGFLSTLLGGYISDKIAKPEDGSRPKSRAWVPAWGSLLAAPLWAAFIFAPDPKTAAAALLAEYLAAECWFGPTLAALYNVVPPERRGTAQGLFSVLTALGNTAPIIVGALSGGRLANYELSNVLVAVISGAYIMCAVLFALAARENEKTISKNESVSY